MDPVQERIEHRAYDLYLKRGKIPGFHEEDWACAEKEILAEIEQGEKIDTHLQETGNPDQTILSGKDNHVPLQNKTELPEESAILEEIREARLSGVGPTSPARPASRSKKLPGIEVQRVQSKNRN